jgi:hypothetical protein
LEFARPVRTEESRARRAAFLVYVSAAIDGRAQNLPKRSCLLKITHVI